MFIILNTKRVNIQVKDKSRLGHNDCLLLLIVSIKNPSDNFEGPNGKPIFLC